MISLIECNNIDEHLTLIIVINNCCPYIFTRPVCDFILYSIDLLTVGFDITIKLITTSPKLYIRTTELNRINQYSNIPVNIQITQNLINLIGFFDKIVRNNSLHINLTSEYSNCKNNIIPLIESSVNPSTKNLLIYADSDKLIDFNVFNITQFTNVITFTRQIINICNIINLYVNRNNLVTCYTNDIVKILLQYLDPNIITSNISYLSIRTVCFAKRFCRLNSNILSVCQIFDQSDNETENIQNNTLILYSTLSDLTYILSLHVDDFNKKIYNIYQRFKSFNCTKNKIKSNDKILYILDEKINRIICNIEAIFLEQIQQFNRITRTSVVPSNLAQCDEWAKNLYNLLDLVASISTVQNVASHKKTRRFLASNIVDEFCQAVKTQHTLIINNIDDIELNYPDHTSCTIYRSVISMLDWTDALKEGSCVGLAIRIVKDNIKKNMSAVIKPSCVATSFEFLCALKVYYDEENISYMSIECNRLMTSFTDDLSQGLMYNFIVPLYIHKTHWRVAKIYLKYIFSIAKYDSLKLYDPNAWKNIYTIFVDIGAYTIGKNISRITIKYMYSLWLTIRELSFEHKFHKGILNIIEGVCHGGMNCDNYMMIGQSLSIGYISTNLIVELIKKVFKDIMHLYSPYIDDYLDDNKQFISERFVDNVRKNYSVEIASLQFALIMNNYLHTIDSTNLTKYLKQHLCIPSQKHIDEFIAFRDTTINDAEREINLIILSTPYTHSELNKYLSALDLNTMYAIN